MKQDFELFLIVFASLVALFAVWFLSQFPGLFQVVYAFM